MKKFIHFFPFGLLIVLLSGCFKEKPYLIKVQCMKSCSQPLANSSIVLQQYGSPFGFLRETFYLETDALGWIDTMIISRNVVLNLKKGESRIYDLPIQSLKDSSQLFLGEQRINLVLNLHFENPYSSADTLIISGWFNQSFDDEVFPNLRIPGPFLLEIKDTLIGIPFYFEHGSYFSGLSEISFDKELTVRINSWESSKSIEVKYYHSNICNNDLVIKEIGIE